MALCLSAAVLYSVADLKVHRGVYVPSVQCETDGKAASGEGRDGATNREGVTFGQKFLPVLVLVARPQLFLPPTPTPLTLLVSYFHLHQLPSLRLFLFIKTKHTHTQSASCSLLASRSVSSRSGLSPPLLARCVALFSVLSSTRSFPIDSFLACCRLPRSPSSVPPVVSVSLCLC